MVTICAPRYTVLNFGYDITPHGAIMSLSHARRVLWLAYNLDADGKRIPKGEQMELKEFSSNELILLAQGGDEIAMERLINMIRKEHMGKYIRRFLRRNVLVENDEIESEFLVGCWEAIPEAKMDIGNPINFICWKGSLKVIHLFRQKLKEGVRINCRNCGTGQLNYRAKDKRAICAKCGATDVDTYMIVVDESQHPQTNDEGQAFDGNHWDRIAPDMVDDNAERQFNTIFYENTIEEIRQRLNGRVLMLFDEIVLNNINRDTSDNYLDEIAKKWGISTACVSVYLRKLRAKIALYLQEHGRDLPAAKRIIEAFGRSYKAKPTHTRRSHWATHLGSSDMVGTRRVRTA